MCCVRDNRSSAWRHGASPGYLNRVRHGFDRSYDLLSLCHHRRYAAWKSACAPGTARLVSKCSFHHPWLAFVPAAGTAIGREHFVTGQWWRTVVVFNRRWSRTCLYQLSDYEGFSGRPREISWLTYTLAVVLVLYFVLCAAE